MNKKLIVAVGIAAISIGAFAGPLLLMGLR